MRAWQDVQWKCADMITHSHFQIQRISGRAEWCARLFLPSWVTTVICQVCTLHQPCHVLLFCLGPSVCDETKLNNSSSIWSERNGRKFHSYICVQTNHVRFRVIFSKSSKVILCLIQSPSIKILLTYGILSVVETFNSTRWCDEMENGWWAWWSFSDLW